MEKLVNHKDISRHCGVDVTTAQRWGRQGLLGPTVIKFPAHYGKSALKLAREIKDARKKLTDKQINDIRRRSSKETYTVLARAFGVDESHISRIVRNERRATS